jgi:hypothetical protein
MPDAQRSLTWKSAYDEAAEATGSDHFVSR